MRCTTIKQAVASATNAIPPLENGDNLSRTEFERRYQAHPEIKKAELIERTVYISSPVRVRKHGVPHSDIISWLGTYRAATPGVNQADNATLRLDLDNEPQPDVSVWIDGGNAFVDGVAEYLVLLTHEQEVRWYSFAQGETVQIEPDADGVLRSTILPGLHLNPARFWQGDLAGLLDVLRRGLATPEHAAFVERLCATKTNG